MKNSLRKMLLSVLDDKTSSASSDIDILTQRIEELNDENIELRTLYLKAQSDIGSLQSIVKTIAINQAQIVSDFHTVYSAIRAAGILDEDHDDDVDSHDEIVSKSSKPDDGGSRGGMGGMIN